MGDANPIRTLGDYFKPSHEGYRNTIELPEGYNVLPLQSDTIRLENLSQKHGLVSRTYSKKSLSSGLTPVTRRTIDLSAGGKLRDRKAEES
ncbi:hypothetical protein Tco_1480256 [Tanacetum coccineum]